MRLSRKKRIIHGPLENIAVNGFPFQSRHPDRIAQKIRRRTRFRTISESDLACIPDLSPVLPAGNASGHHRISSVQDAVKRLVHPIKQMRIMILRENRVFQLCESTRQIGIDMRNTVDRKDLVILLHRTADLHLIDTVI